MKAYYVYMMTNRSRVVLYTGVTNSLERRLWFHRNVSPRSFTKKYRVDRLVYYETFRNPRDAISQEKEIKGWRREKKNDLVRRLKSEVGRFGRKAIQGSWARSLASLGMTLVDLARPIAGSAVATTRDHATGPRYADNGVVEAFVPNACSQNGKGARPRRRTPFQIRLGARGIPRRSTSQLYGLFATTCGADLLTSIWALTFWICAACSLS